MRLVADGLDFPEGPLILPNGDLLVCEMRAGRLTRITTAGRETIATLGGGANGAALGPDGAIYVCNNGGSRFVGEKQPDGTTRYRTLTPGESMACIPGQIQRVAQDGTVTTLYTACGDIALMKPNDLVFDRAGNFYFTDSGDYEGPTHDTGMVAEGMDFTVLHMLATVTHRRGGSVFYASPDGSMIREVAHPFASANGVGLSPDETILYVSETTTGRLWAFDLTAPGKVGGRRCLGVVPGRMPLNLGMCDSLTVDSAGNILVGTLGNGGITIFSPDGTTIRHVATGDDCTTNCCFGGPDRRTLYVTCALTGRLIAFDDWPTAGLRLNFAP